MLSDRHFLNFRSFESYEMRSHLFDLKSTAIDDREFSPPSRTPGAQEEGDDISCFVSKKAR